jgi:hypothetical protein
MFCGNFASDDVHHLLLGFDADYKYSLINIYEFVVSSAIGCMLCGDNAFELALTSFGLAEIYSLFEGKDDAELSACISDAFEGLLKAFPPKTHLLEQYARESLWGIASRIISNYRTGSLHKIMFVSSDESLQRFEFTDAERMNDAVYRKLVTEVMGCQTPDEKAALIKERVHSISDLEDLIFDSELDDNDLTALFKSQSPLELAVLAKRHPLEGAISDAEDELEGLDVKEQELRISLHLHIASLPQDSQKWISRAMEQMENNFLHMFDNK